MGNTRIKKTDLKYVLSKLYKHYEHKCTIDDSCYDALLNYLMYEFCPGRFMEKLIEGKTNSDDLKSFMHPNIRKHVDEYINTMNATKTVFGEKLNLLWTENGREEFLKYLKREKVKDKLKKLKNT